MKRGTSAVAGYFLTISAVAGRADDFEYLDRLLIIVKSHWGRIAFAVVLRLLLGATVCYLSAS